MSKIVKHDKGVRLTLVKKNRLQAKNHLCEDDAALQMVLQIDSGSDHSDHPAQVRGIKGVLGSNKLSSLQFCGGGRGQYRGRAEVGLICQKRDDLGIINIAITVEWTHKYWLQIHSASPPNPPPANPPAASQLCQGQEPSPANTLNFLLFPYRICNRECISFIFFD